MSRANRSKALPARMVAGLVLITGLITTLSACFGVWEHEILDAAETVEFRMMKNDRDDAQDPASLPIKTSSKKTNNPIPTVTYKKNDNTKKTEATVTNHEAESKSATEDRKGWPELKELYERFQDEGKNTPQQTVTRLVVYLKEQYVAAFNDRESTTEPVRIFPCSSGHVDGHTPIGTFSLGMKTVESWLFDNALAQYGGQITGNILFHSLPSYDGSLNRGLKISDLNAMGQPASHGCVRLFCMDSKWLYVNCPSGTTVEVVAERRDFELNMPSSVHYLRLKDGAPTWDPSDPDPANPYHDYSILEKWAVEKPWEKPFKVVPPVWPQHYNSAPAEEIPVEVTEERPTETEETKASEVVTESTTTAQTEVPTVWYTNFTQPNKPADDRFEEETEPPVKGRVTGNDQVLPQNPVNRTTVDETVPSTWTSPSGNVPVQP